MKNLDTLELPSTDLEEWRYSRVGELDLPAYELARAPGELSPVRALAELFERRGATVVVSDGVVVSVDIEPPVVESGVRIESGVDSAMLPGDSDVFVEINAEAPGSLRIEIPAGVTVADPIVVVHHISTVGTLACLRTEVVAGADSAATVVELSSSESVDALSLPVTTLDLAAASRLRHVSLQQLSPVTHQIGRLAATVGQSATLHTAHAALGGSYARMRFDVSLAGRGAHGDVSALYFGDGNQMHDLRTFQNHDAPDTSSVLAFKGAVADTSHAVYTGLIRIGESARRANAEQSNRIVKLSPQAWAESVPNLEIATNDVRCSHASAIGPIDADQAFYLQSRGVPPHIAERLIVAGFFRDLLDGVDVEAVRRLVTSEVADRLERLA